jgi:dienelactone hydrolase
MPDLFNNDPVPMTMTEGPQLNLTEWFARHPTWQIDQVVEQTIRYMQTQLGDTRIGAVGYCLGGKHVARFMTSGKGIDLGFVAHPANLTDEEIQAIARPISVAAGGMFTSYPATTFSGHERAGADSCRTR